MDGMMGGMGMGMGPPGGGMQMGMSGISIGPGGEGKQVMDVPKSTVGKIIGKGGETIQQIQVYLYVQYLQYSPISYILLTPTSYTPITRPTLIYTEEKQLSCHY